MLLLVVLITLADVQKFAAAIRTADPRYLGISFGAGMMFFVVIGVTWHLFLRQIDVDPSYTTTMNMVFAGHFLNSITPLGQLGGEPLMAHVISQHTEADYEESLSTVMATDIVNFAPFVTFFLGAAVIGLLGSLPPFLFLPVVAGLAISVIMGVIAYLLLFDDRILAGFFTPLFNIFDDYTGRYDEWKYIIRDKLHNLKHAFEQIGQNKPLLGSTFLIAHLNLLAQGVCLYFIFLALGVPPHIFTIFVIIVLSLLAGFSPTPGGTGTFEAAFSGIMTLFYPVGLDTAAAAAILFRLTTYWPGLVIGYFSLLHLNPRSMISSQDRSG